MSLLRPSCAQIARRLCSSLPHPHPHSYSPPDAIACPPLLSLIHSRRPPHTIPTRPSQHRSLSTTPRLAAKTIDTPDNPTAPHHHPKRTVRIGPLPNGRVHDEVARRIFNRKLSPADANNVLRILHHRRTTGSLADYGVDNLGKQYTHVTREVALKGLEWLRKQYPIDEARAAQEWAEKEANRIAYELWLADPETESKYKDPARAFREQMQKEEAEREQHAVDNQKMGILHTGKSQFELNIEQKRRERLEQVTRVAEEKERNEREMEEKLASGEWVRTPTGKQLMRPDQTTYVDVFGREQVSRRKEMMEAYQQKAVTNFKDETEMLSSTTLSQRLLPMTAFVLVVSLLCFSFAHYYQDPSPSYRLFPDLSSTTATMAALVATNVAIAIAWRIMPLWPLMTRYFMHVPGYPRAVQSVLNVFSHVQYEHLLANMMMLVLVGPVCHDLVGRGVFMGTYVASGALGTLASLYWANLGRGNIGAHSVGASAAIWGIAALYCLLTDQERVKMPYLKDAEFAFWPKMLFFAFVAMEIHTALRGKRSTMDHASHFGGMLVGMGTAGYLRATGFQQARRIEGDGGVTRESVDAKTVDVGAIVKDSVEEVKRAVK